MNSLKIKMVALFSALIILMGGSIGFLIIQSSSKLIIQSMSDQATKIGEYTLSQVDPGKYSEILKDRKGNEYYKQLREEFEEIRVANGLNFLYTMGREKKIMDMSIFML